MKGIERTFPESQHCMNFEIHIVLYSLVNVSGSI